MFIIIGANSSGKTVLAERLSTLTGMDITHHTKDTSYEDYLRPLVTLEAQHMIMDRYIFCDVPYSKLQNRKLTYTLKEWHNIVLLTLSLNPLIILCTHKPPEEGFDSHGDILYSDWDSCLGFYRTYLAHNNINYVVYDYEIDGKNFPMLNNLRNEKQAQTYWWRTLWRQGFGSIGSLSPEVLIVAERLGPNNMNNLPFESGPTGHMMSDLLAGADIPLGSIAITNLVKAPRRDARIPNKQDSELFELELTHMKPKGIILMGSTALVGAKVAKSLNIPYAHVPHLGYFHHKGATDMTQYHKEFRNLYNQLLGIKTGGSTWKKTLVTP